MHQVCRSLDYVDRYIVWCTWYTCNHFCDTCARWLYDLNLSRRFERMTSWWTSIRPCGLDFHENVEQTHEQNMAGVYVCCVETCVLSNQNLRSSRGQGEAFWPSDRRTEDSILRHLQDTESHDWLGEITHWATQVTCDTRVVQGSLQPFKGALYIGALKRKKVKMWYS